ncbi:pilus assembly protein [Glaciimonas immobilis]|uniref:Type IV pilus assembly protein PilY1 n=1 Tax=Glaciimonas immobilis TaxID=728004 RepID=A0A840RPT7_9BURK|nr:PilC/PilY family type IV pilus protein [Glaciimonas immobilis]KAF3996930.1 hypothetical protein HAV38_14675 [Glaciimonas immobilis]MBB5199755.1 type IV pilus assembly protein PilY1 [Glaciimonas immobilis]
MKTWIYNIAISGISVIALGVMMPASGLISQQPLVSPNGFSALVYSDRALNDASIAYQASFTTAGWAGQLKAYRTNFSGSAGALLWDAEQHMPDWQARNIVAWNPERNRAVDFYWDNLTAAQQHALGSPDILSYLRGDTALQNAHGVGKFRDRQGRLGGIVNSLPLYVKNTHFGYQMLPDVSGGGASYLHYLHAKNLRSPMLFVGANDGMLHGFDATTGVEKFAYVPRAVFPHLKALSHADFQHRHRYSVDGQITEGDAYLPQKGPANSVWKTLILSAAGAGARSIAALDISTPDKLDAGSVLWENSDQMPDGTIDKDMGYVLGDAAVVRLRNGQWAALYGNGIESDNKKATLYIVNIEDGSLIAKIHTHCGGDGAPNGLSTPALLFNGHREVIAAYAGDLQGNVWKFDLGDTDSAKWRVAYGNRPLFAAQDRHGRAQPVVQQPVMARHPQGGRMIMFGTGKFFEVDDPKDTQVQTIYGIWEQADGVTAIHGAYQLQQQTLSPITGGRTISNNPVHWSNRRGWYVDLLNLGERVVGKLQIINGLLVILTYTPEGHGGQINAPSSELMAVDFTTGTADKKGFFTTLPPDQMGIRVPPSMASPTIITQPDGKRSVVIHGQDGSASIVPLAVTPRLPFRTWHQLPVAF